MLDSTISKILTAKQVDQTTYIDPEDTQLSDSTGQTSTNPEAEVRLVVRFIVEEQIVYKGKVKRALQLDSEELSRVVSRVVWNDNNESDMPANSEVEVYQNEDESRVATSSSEESQHNQTTTQIDQDQGCAPKSTESDTSTTDEKTNESQDNVQENPTSNIDSSDHEAYTKSENDSRAVICQEEILVTQPRESCTPDRTTTNGCDIKIERSPSVHLEADLESSPNPVLLHDVDKPYDIEKEQDTSSSPYQTLGPHEYGHQCTDYLTESQTVADTLNDCVNTVDIQIRQQNSSASNSPDSEEKQEPTSNWLDYKHLESYKFNGLDSNLESETSQRTNSNISSNDSCTNDHEKPDEPEGLADKKENNVIAEEYIIPYESDTNCSNKRKNLGQNGTATKRIRRTTNNKEQRYSKTKINASKNIENSGRRQSVANARSSNVSLLADNQHIRQNKIFAKWTDNHFYPGTILKLANDRKYQVGFYDGATKKVSETDLIPLCNIAGKQVRVMIAKDHCVNAIVHNQRSPVNDQPMFDVEYQQDGLVRKCVPFKDIFLTGEQGTPLISQSDRNPGASNFADVDLDNIIYEKRSRRFQDMDDFELTDNSSISLSL